MQKIQVDRVELGDMWLAGVSTADIANHFGCSQSVIHRHLKAACLQRPVGPQKAWKEMFSEQDILDLYAELRSTPLVAKRVGCTSKTVWNILKKNGAEIRGKSGKDHSQWNGGRAVDSHGYILAHRHDHPHAAGGYVPEHRLVMESHIGRLLTQDEEVHHRNLDKSDNRLENLKLYSSSSDHMKSEHASRDRIDHMMKVRKSRTDAIQNTVEPILSRLVNHLGHSPKTISQLAGLPSSFVGSWCRRCNCQRLQGKRPVSPVTQESRELAAQLSSTLRPLVRGEKKCKQAQPLTQT
jgi:DNA-binding CsgD family transcriptional regulator